MKDKIEKYKEDVNIMRSAESRKMGFEEEINSLIREKADKISRSNSRSDEIALEFNSLLGNSIRYISKKYNIGSESSSRPIMYSKKGIYLARHLHCYPDILKCDMSYNENGISMTKPDFRYYGNLSRDVYIPWEYLQPDMITKIEDSIEAIKEIRKNIKEGENIKQTQFEGKMSKTVILKSRNEWESYQETAGSKIIVNLLSNYGRMDGIIRVINSYSAPISESIINDILSGLDSCIEFSSKEELKYKDCLDKIAGYNAPFKMLKQIKES